MVKLNGLHPPTLDEKSYTYLPMTGEETGLGTSASPLAGYLGKVQERCASLENCPWCRAKGLNSPLHSYRISLQESITLCTNSQCLFPLVSRSLDDVLASLVPPEPHPDPQIQTHPDPQIQTQPDPQIQLIGKRKNLSGSEEVKPVAPLAKRQCSEAEDLPALQNGDASLLKAPPSSNEKALDRDLCRIAKDDQVNGYHKDSDWPVDGNGTYQEDLGDMEAEQGVATQEKALPGPINGLPADTIPASLKTAPPSLSSSATSLLSPQAGPNTPEGNAEEKMEEKREEESVAGEREEAAPPLARAERSLSASRSEPTPPGDADTFSDEEEEEEELRALEENGHGESCPDVVLRLCSVDLSQSRVPVLPEEEEEEEEERMNPAVNQRDGPSGKTVARTLSNPISLKSEVEVISSEAEDPMPRTRTRLRGKVRKVTPLSGTEDEPGAEEDLEGQAPVRKRGTSRVRNGKKRTLTDREENLEKKEEPIPARVAIDLSKTITGIYTSIKHEEEEEQQQQVNTPSAKRERSVACPSPLFWKNKSNLCWLDVLLVALVNCRTLRGSGPPEEPAVSPVWSVLRQYDKATALVQTHHRIGRGRVKRVSTAVWKQVSALLETLRMDTFRLLQPKLQCRLGQMDTPVFAMPLLFKMDAWANPLFQLSFSWKQECTSCKHTNNLSCVSVLPSFGPVVSDWLPLNAAQLVSCQACSDKEQIRKMSLESVPPVFALHFVEGLPDNNMAAYSFTLHEKLYSVTTVIQYDLKQKHFVTWVRQPDGSWLKFDGLNYPKCATHKKLEVPPKEIHVVFWEKEPLPEELLSTCSPTTPFLDSPVPQNKPTQSQSAEDFTLDKPAKHLAKSSVSPHDDVDIVEALTVSEDHHESAMETALTADASIGSTTLLDAFEGLSHQDLVTLTLVEIEENWEGNPGEAESNAVSEGRCSSTGQAASPSVAEEVTADPVTLDVRSLRPATDCPSPGQYPDPVSQSPQPPGAESPDGAESDPDSEPEIASDSPNESGDPTFEPKSKRRRRSQAKIKLPKLPAKAAPAKRTVALATTSGIISASAVGGGAAVCHSHAPVGGTRSSKPAGQPRQPERPLSLDQDSRLSFLLSRNPGRSQASTSTPLSAPAAPRLDLTPVPKRDLTTAASSPCHGDRHPGPAGKSQPPPGSFHSSAQRPRPPALAVPRAVYPKPLLKTGGGQAQPAKPAEMFGGFSSRSTPPQPQSQDATLSPHQSSQRPSLLTPSDVISNVPQSPSRVPKKTLTFNSAPAILPGATRLLASKKLSPPGNHSSTKVPAGLSETETLRYKLLKKLKAKKKKLEKLNLMLGDPGGVGKGGELGQKPGRTPPISQYTVSSSTSAYSSPAYDEFFADLLSPATTASNLSPDSTGYMLTNGQEGGGGSANAGNAIGGELLPQQQFEKQRTVTQQPVANGSVATAGDDFLEEFISERTVQQSEMESEALSALDLFF